MEQRGSIVNCASVNSIMAGPGTSGYSAAKHSVNGITKAAALEARSHGIRVNSVGCTLSTYLYCVDCDDWVADWRRSHLAFSLRRFENQ